MATSKRPPASRSKNGGVTTDAKQNRLKRLTAELRDLLEEDPGGERAEDRREAARPRKPGFRATTEEGVQIQMWEDDPDLEAAGTGEPTPAHLVSADVPENDQAQLQTQILDPRPEPGTYEPPAEEFLYWNASAALARGVNFWGPLLPAQTRWSADNDPLQVELDHKDREDLNAFYARDSGLNFFHQAVGHVTYYSGESPDVVCHELGHAILDALKPELFDALSTEVAAFHEGFADVSAILSALQLESIRESVLDETRGRLNANSRVSRQARQLGWAIRQIAPTAVDNDSLRNAANEFFYQDPSGLPPSAPARQLSSEPHSFSRVFSGAMLDVLAAMFRVGPAGSSADDSAKLLAVANDAGKLLVEGVRLASVGAAFYSQVAAGMVQADQTLNGGRYRTALSSSFVQRGILSPTAAVALVQDLQAHGGQAFGVTRAAAAGRSLQFDGDNEGYKKTGKDAPTLPLRPLTTRFGVTVYAHLPAEPSRFGVASAAVTGGTERTMSPEEDARSFLEDLIQLGRIAPETGGARGVMPLELIGPPDDAPSARTHYIAQEEGKPVVKRHHFDCGFPGCRHGR